MNLGIDVAKWNGIIDWKKVKTNKVIFSILKVTKKNNTVEDSFEKNYNGASEENLIIGGYRYVYAKNEKEAEVEANELVKVLNGRKMPFGIWIDMEDESISKLGKEKLGKIIDTEADILKKAGYDPGVYCNYNWYKNVLDGNALSKKYPIWIAKYGKNDGKFDLSQKPNANNVVAWQYTSKGKIDGINGDVDLNISFTDISIEESEKNIKQHYDRNKVVRKLKEWIGFNEKNGTHKKIIDIYNLISPLPSGYKVKYTDPWCAATVSAVYHDLGYDDIFPLECSCARMIEKAKKMGIWIEDDNYIPSEGDAIIYDWQDDGKGDNTGNPDHVGIVESVSIKDIKVIEGNYHDMVSVRTIPIGGRYIRGFIAPKFVSLNKSDSPNTDNSSQNNTVTSNTQGAIKPIYILGNTYTLNSNMYVRNEPNGSKKKYSLLTSNARTKGYPDKNGNGILKKGTRVTCKDFKNIGKSTWIKIPSGWVCAIGSEGKIYIS